MKFSTLTFGLAGALLISTSGALIAQTEAETTEAATETTTETTAEATPEAPAEPVVASLEDLGIVVATVNDEPITLGELLIVKRELPAEYLQGDQTEVMQALLDQVSVQRLLSDRAAQTPILDLQLTNVTRTTRANAALTAYIDENLTDEYMQSTYDELIGNQPDTTEWKAAHVLVATEEEAQAVKVRAENGEDFAELAKEISTGPSGPNGGDLGWFGPGQMVPAFETAVTGMEKGQVSDPVQTEFGWHVIYLEDTRISEKPSFEEVEPQLREYASSKLVDEYVTSLKDENAVTISEDFDPNLVNAVLPE